MDRYIILNPFTGLPLQYGGFAVFKSQAAVDEALKGLQRTHDLPTGSVVVRLDCTLQVFGPGKELP